ncbi:hypothetical protein LRL17_30385 (plasmid) [Rhodococcus qingshengii]|uniref:hypothetical protein n=1 Tax=Rhodococcus qingshengii TaxID=334542 RepID=UPI001BA49C44|nr:hypothetical protein [Rhodococcus qingshengii]MBS3690815.1 hypothetical protein [Rhodococcus qingshengii]UGQ55211.1 hypothetical protein LRL17_30385 [Rhodococcus qingshengii]
MVKLLTEEQRRQVLARSHGPTLAGVLARHHLKMDDKRRRNLEAQKASEEQEGFLLPALKLSDRGYRGAGGGRMASVGRQVEYRASSAQAAGMWPWAVGAGAPLIGTPVGRHLLTGAPVLFDLLSWFVEGLITAPVGFVLGLNGYGKSSFVRRMVLGGVAQKVTTLVLADVKPDYRNLIEAVDGQVIDLGYGYGRVNPLAGGVLGSILPRLAVFPELARKMLTELRARQLQTMSGLIELSRGSAVRDYEETIISSCIEILYNEKGFTAENPPLIEDMYNLVKEGHPELMENAAAVGEHEYREATRDLQRSLRGLVKGSFGEIFNGHTTTEIDLDAPAICIDVSHIPEGHTRLKAAVMLVCWSDGFAAIDAAHALADAGLGPQRRFQAVMDELWQVLGLGEFMVDRVNSLTRLNRTIATALWMITHTITDLEAMGSVSAANKAKTFIERARVKVIGAVPEAEIDRLERIVKFTGTEADMVTGWSSPPARTGERRKEGEPKEPPPGQGKFLIKVGETRTPGIPVQLIFTPSEIASGIHDTNSRYGDLTSDAVSDDEDGFEGEGAA